MLDAQHYGQGILLADFRDRTQCLSARSQTHPRLDFPAFVITMLRLFILRKSLTRFTSCQILSSTRQREALLVHIVNIANIPPPLPVTTSAFVRGILQLNQANEPSSNMNRNASPFY